MDYEDNHIWSVGKQLKQADFQLRQLTMNNWIESLRKIMKDLNKGT
jgi:hypothetical protein